MENNREKRLEIAARIYDLDAEVYHVLGSGLGRVFNHHRHTCIEEIADHLSSQSMNHIVRSELALIGNMARTIPDRKARAHIMSKYNEVLKQVEALHTSFGSLDILDEEMARLNRASLSGRFTDGSHLIICIGRTYGSAGTDIGFALADSLKINYYDSEIFADVLNRLEADKEDVQDHASFAHNQDLNMNLGIVKGRTLKEHLREFNRYHGLSKSDAIFFNQSDLLRDMAQREDFIIMGRCADVILTNMHIPHISIFINAPFELRVRRVMKLDNLSYKEAVKFLKRLDRRHRHYYEFYTGRKWGDSVNYDLCINSAGYGIEGSVKLIERIINQHAKR